MEQFQLTTHLKYHCLQCPKRHQSAFQDGPKVSFFEFEFAALIKINPSMKICDAFVASPRLELIGTLEIGIVSVVIYNLIMVLSKLVRGLLVATLWIAIVQGSASVQMQHSEECSNTVEASVELSHQSQ